MAPLLGRHAIALRRWKDPKHPLRVDPAFKLTTVPTLMVWGQSGRQVAAVGEEFETCKTESDVETIVKPFLWRHEILESY